MRKKHVQQYKETMKELYPHIFQQYSELPKLPSKKVNLGLLANSVLIILTKSTSHLPIS